ncbi:MAG: PAS-domain containing protein [Erythrobacter sp.]|uniref:hybrid sensor histidine kinase/response regulator n=1 Tax=Erythrobacter sp. TaxID=1042 RepID=UPI0026304E5C|nr:PAS-domain containing protein [Erythrobacter sp.]MDJ0979639.1 PAS-domain containing protein [Erythrobacter sp.]
MLFGAAIAAACLYLLGLFWLAARRDAHFATQAVSGPARWLTKRTGIVYGLGLTVYCTSWTFYGGVGTAATSGLDYLPIYLGPILVFTMGFGLVRKVLAQSKAQHSTSIADFLSARYGKSASVAALVTIIASVGSLPYMALQLQSVGSSLLTLSPELADTVAADELVLMVAGIMALFAILFGAKRADRAGDNAGLVLTIAVEAVVKAIALIAVASLAIFVLISEPIASQAAQHAQEPVFSGAQINARFFTLTLIAACAALCLPRQFHMTFVEAGGERATRPMQWVFPIYLVLTAAVIVPIVLAGLSALPAGTDPDSIVLALPLAQEQYALAVLVFLGGFSASAGMIVVASVALSTMITNDLIAPLIFRKALKSEPDRSQGSDRAQLAAQLLMVRRLVIAGLLFFAYMVYLGLGSIASLAGLGTLAFAAAAQFAPGLVLGMASESGNKCGMICGLVVGALAWLVLLIVPAASASAPVVSIHSDPLVSGVVLSLGANCAAYWIGSELWKPTLLDASQAAAFVGTPSPGVRPKLVTNKRVADVRILLTQFVGAARADAAITSLPGYRTEAHAADAALVEMAERVISGTIGTSSARMLISSWSGGDAIPLPDVVAMFDETSKRLNFSGDLLQIAIENIDTGVALVDADMTLVAWNTRYQEMFDLPNSIVQVGTPIADLIRYNQRHRALSEEEIDDYVQRRLDHMRAGHRHRHESEQIDGRVMRIVGSPTPGGGYVTSYTDITADRRAEQALEDKVTERTEQLRDANAALAEATQSKTRFLAAASHDLIQPLNAARLFASALGEEMAGNDDLRKMVRDLDGSIASADRLIRTLLDISKLDSGGIVPKVEETALDQVFEEVEREFAVQAQAKGIALRRVRTSAWVMTDRTLLTSALRNLVSNAIRYTASGGVLLGVRRAGKSVMLCVHDTGRGIGDDDIDRIFNEFERGASKDHEGLGLGLAIVRRTTGLLGARIEAQSTLGRGSRFALAVPVKRWGTPMTIQAVQRPVRTVSEARVLVVDNDTAVLTATSSLLSKWGLRPVTATSLLTAIDACPEPPDIVIMDYRLNGDERGDSVYSELCMAWKAQPPAILLTAEASDETEFAAVAMDANRLLKPSSPAALRALISTCLAQSSTASTQQRDQAFTESVAG